MAFESYMVLTHEVSIKKLTEPFMGFMNHEVKVGAEGLEPPTSRM